MRFRSASVRWLAPLALAYLNIAAAQVPQPQPSPPSPAALSFDALAQHLSSDSVQPLEQAWDVVELGGQPMLSDSQRPARVVLRPQGLLWVDGGCNYFSGRVEYDDQGLFRISKYGSTQRVCGKPPRSEAFLNSALMMVDNFRWDRDLLLRNGSSELLRLRPSANQDTQELEQNLGRRAVPPAALPSARMSQVAPKDCRPVKASKGAGKSRATKASACQSLRAKAVKPAKSAKSSNARRVKAGPASKSSAKQKPPLAQKRPKP